MEVKNSVVPTEEQMKGFMEPGPEGPIYMLNLLKFQQRFSANSLAGRVSRNKLRVLRFQVKELLKQPVIFTIRDERSIKDIIAMGMKIYLLT